MIRNVPELLYKTYAGENDRLEQEENLTLGNQQNEK